MQKFNVTGMSCAACQTRVEKAVSKVRGVTECSVSLLTNSMGVEGSASASEIIKAVEKAGYGASLCGQPAMNDASTKSDSNSVESELLKNTEITVLIKRLILSAVFLAALMYVSMGHMMWNWPLPVWFTGNHMAVSLLQMILAAIIMLINKKFFVSGFKSLIHGAPNMDTLVALGSGISFAYSTVVLFMMTKTGENHELAMHYMDNLYFESAATILTLITVGKLLESVSKGKTTNALKSLMKLSPKTATLLQDGQEIKVNASEVVPGDIFVLRPGDSVPVDGIVIEGNSAINESALTGESIPVEKTEGSVVSAATINISGFLKCRATRVGQDTTLSKIIQMVSDAAATKAPIAKIADKVSGVFVPVVLGLSIVTIAVWLICGAEISFALARGISVLVVSCPCALGLATPVAIMVGNGLGARNGILFKTSAALETAGKIQIVALDKTGTITKGEPRVTDIIPVEKITEKELLQTAASAEQKSEHPLAKAVLLCAQEAHLELCNSTDFENLAGNGIRAIINGSTVIAGSGKFIRSQIAISDAFKNQESKLAAQGKTPLFFAKNGELLGIIAVADTIKTESPEAIKQLRNMGIHVVMLTGDNELTANAIAREAGVERVIAGVLPDGKAEIINELKQQGKVAMVGDGINDAPALTSADLGIAIGAGADVAIDAADVVLVKSNLEDVPAAIRLGRGTLRNIRENLFWAFFYNIILIPVAAGVYYKAFGLQMNPMFGAAAMSLSSFCVVTNALRLNFLKIKNVKHDHKIKNNIKESVMERILKVEGMMCSHCEAHVKEALEALKGVDSAFPNHETGEVKVTLSKEVKDKDFEKAITKAGYKFLG